MRWHRRYPRCRIDAWLMGRLLTWIIGQPPGGGIHCSPRWDYGCSYLIRFLSGLVLLSLWGVLSVKGHGVSGVEEAMVFLFYFYTLLPGVYLPEDCPVGYSLTSLLSGLHYVTHRSDMEPSLPCKPNAPSPQENMTPTTSYLHPIYTRPPSNPTHQNRYHLRLAAAASSAATRSSSSFRACPCIFSRFSICRSRSSLRRSMISTARCIPAFSRKRRYWQNSYVTRDAPAKVPAAQLAALGTGTGEEQRLAGGRRCQPRHTHTHLRV